MASEADLDHLVLTTFSHTFGNHGILDKTWTEYIRDPQGKQLALQNGMPDLVGHLYGFHIEVEDKKYPNRPTTEQYARLRRVNSSGGYGAMCVMKGEQVWWVPDTYITSRAFSWAETHFWVPIGTIRSINLMPLMAWYLNKKGETK